MNPDFDIAVIGAGSGGLTAAAFAARLGARVALIEKARIGGDCTWSGCVPSKALLKVARIAHHARTAHHYGIFANTPQTDMAKVRNYVRKAIEQAYRAETPEELRNQGIEVIEGAEARFLDPQTVAVSGRTIRANAYLITTGAHPIIPPITGLDQVPYFTYEQLFENDRLPRRLLIVGGGPIGVEMAQAYRRLGSEVSVIAQALLPNAEPESRQRIRRILEREGIQIVCGLALAAKREQDEIIVTTDADEIKGDMLLVATGRAPNVDGLDLDRAGVRHSAKGIPVDDRLRTNVRHIYAAGDILGGEQFTHLAGWQAFQAARNALLPGHDSGISHVLPRVTFTDPELAEVGLNEERARSTFGEGVNVHTWEMAHTDRAICDNDTEGLIKVITKEDGTLVGASIVAARAGEMIMEFALALKHGWKAADLAATIHPYPTYATPIQQLSADMAVESLFRERLDASCAEYRSLFGEVDDERIGHRAR